MSWLLDILKNRIFIHQIICMKFSRYNVDCNSFITSTMETERFELLTPCLQGRCSPNWATPPFGFLFNSIGLAFKLMGLSGLEPPTSRLSGVRSNRLSYKPISIWQPPAFPYRHQYSIIGRFRLNHRVRDVDGCFPKAHRHQKIVSASQIH